MFVGGALPVIGYAAQLLSWTVISVLAHGILCISRAAKSAAVEATKKAAVGAEAIKETVGGVAKKVNGIASKPQDGSLTAKLLELQKLHDDGIITKEEFERAKAKELGIN